MVRLGRFAVYPLTDLPTAAVKAEEDANLYIEYMRVIGMGMHLSSVLSSRSCHGN